MKIRLWLKPVSSDGQYIQMDKGKYPKFLICVPDTNPPRDAWPCFLCKVDHNDASNQPCPPPSPRPLHYICPLLWTKTVWWSVSTPNKWWSPASHVKQQKGQLSPPTLLISSSWFLAMQYPKREKIQPPTNSISGCFEVLPGPPPLLTLNVLCRTRDLICEGLIFCANVWNDCVVLVCVRPTHEHLGRYIFLFSNTVVHLLT